VCRQQRGLEVVTAPFDAAALRRQRAALVRHRVAHAQRALRIDAERREYRRGRVGQESREIVRLQRR
jgi:hypothetical protein